MKLGPSTPTNAESNARTWIKMSWMTPVWPILLHAEVQEQQRQQRSAPFLILPLTAMFRPLKRLIWDQWMLCATIVRQRGTSQRGRGRLRVLISVLFAATRGKKYSLRLSHPLI